MKITTYVKGLELLFKRKNTLMQAPGFKVLAYIFTIGFALTTFILGDIFTTIGEVYFDWETYDYVVPLLYDSIALHFDTQRSASLMSMIWVVFFGTIVSCYYLIVLPTTYGYYINNIASNQPEAADHGHTIADILRNIRFEPVEYLAIFSAQGQKVDEITCYRPSSVDLRPSTDDYMLEHPGCIAVHNHPQSFDSFSAEDVCFAIERCCSASIVVARNYVYTLELAPECREIDSEKLYALLQATRESLDWNPCRSEREYVAFILGINVTVAEQYGMKLTVERFKDCQYFKAEAMTNSKTGLVQPNATNKHAD